MPKDLQYLPPERRAAVVGERLHQMFENGLLGIFFYRNDGVTTAANAAFLEMVGYGPEDVNAGRVDWGKLTPPDGAARDAVAVRQLLDTGRCEPFEKVFLHRDGRRVPVLTGGASVDDDGGVAFVLDLSERKRLEREERAAAEMRQAALDAADMGECKIDFAAGTFTQDSRAAAMFGADPIAARGPRPIADLMAAVHPNDREEVQAGLGKVMAGEPCEQQFRVVRPDGSVRTLRTTGLPDWAGAARTGPPAGLTAAIRDVTDAAAAARRTALLAEVLENTSDFVGVANDRGEAEIINRAGREMLDLAEEEVAGLKVASLHRPGETEGGPSIGIVNARRKGRWTGETELLRKDGTAVPVSQSVVAHRDAAGTISHYSTICRDITARVRAEAVSAARRECLSRVAAGEALTDVLPVLARAAETYLPTPNLVCILLRDGAAEGVLPEPTDRGGTGPGERLRLAAAPSLPDSFQRGIDGLAADESGGACGAAAVRNERVIVEDLSADPLCEQFREFTASHNLRAVWSTPIRSATGQALGTFAVYHDHARSPSVDDLAVVDPLVQTCSVVVERAASDARAAKLLGDLAESERRFRGTFENVGVGVAHVGFDGAWLRVNRRLCEIVGYDEAELRTKTFQDITHADDLDADLEQFGRLLRGEIESYSMRKRYFRKDGEKIWIALTVALQRDEAGGPLYAISVVEDVTAMVLAEKKLRQLNATLETKVAARTARVRKQKARLERLARGLAEAENRERRRLAHVVHDDLQQILAAAKFSASRAAADHDPTGAAAQTVELLDEAMNEGRSLTQDLVPTVLYDRGLVPALAALCRRTAERFRIEIGFAGENGGPPDPELVERDYVWGPLMYQAARELLFNAAKHAPGAAARVTLTRGVDRRVRLSVVNDAPALPVERPAPADGQDDPHFESGAAGEGFGLFSIREQTALAGGDVTTTIPPGGGYLITVTLPHADPDAAPVPPMSAMPQESLRVMIVDDHRIVRSALAGLLRGAEGITVVGEAADGQEAVDRVAELAPDAVVMDVTMPRMDGIEATRRVKELLPDARVVGLSMHTRDDMAEAMCAAGAEAYVPKGGPPEELLRALRGNPDPIDCCEKSPG